MSDDLVRQCIEQLQVLVRCRCHEAYKGRGLHDYAEALKAVADRIEELEAKHQETFQMYVDANEARIDAEEKLAKLRTFLDELWDSQGYDARELHDLLKELDGVSDE